MPKLDVIADKTWDEIDKTWDEFTLETWDGWIEFCYCIKIYNTSGTKVAEISGDLKNTTLTDLSFEFLKQGGCGAFSFTLAKPYTQATIDRDYRVDVHFFHLPTPWYSGKIINLPKEGTDKKQTYSGWGYFNELEKKVINTQITPGQNITTAVETIVDTDIVPYTSILKDTSLLEQVANHTLVATIPVDNQYAKNIFSRLKELAVNYKYGVNAQRKFYFQSIDTSIKEYWHVGKHLTEFLPEEDPSQIVKKAIVIFDPQLFTDGHQLIVTSEADDYNGLYEEVFSVPEIISPFSETNIALGKSVSTNPTGTGAANVTDGDYATLWASGVNQAAGHYIEIDLGQDFENISRVIVDSIHDNAKEFVAQSVKVEIKPAGGSYSTILESDKGISWKPELTFRPTKGRYVKVSLTKAGDKHWKVGEVEVNQLNLADAQRWADGKVAELKDVKKRATARIAGVDKLIINRVGCALIEPVGKARIFDKDGLKIDDYQIMACRYSLSSKGLNLDLELGEEDTRIVDPLKDMERRIREAELTGVRRAANLSLSKGFQLGAIKQTFIGPKIIQTPHLEVGSIYAKHYHELRNTYVFSDQDSLDGSYPLEMLFEIVSEMTAIVNVKLSFKIRNFRAYATGVPSGGGHTTPSGGGHTTPAGGGATSGSQGTPSGGGSTTGSETHDHSGSTAGGAGDHSHIIKVYQGDVDYNVGIQAMYDNFYCPDTQCDIDTMEASGSHTHPLNITADGAHGHSTPNHTHPDHTHTTPDHQHSVSDHQHTVSNHTHSLTFGIYEYAQSPTVNVYVDNGAGYGASIGQYTSDQTDIDITAHVSGVGIKQIKFTSNKLTRIAAHVLCKVDLTA